MKKFTFFKALWCYSIIFSLLLSSCVTTKKKGEVSKLSKFYHNVTSEYNGYFNANELYNTSLNTLVAANEDNYTKIIELYDYISVPDPKIVNSDLDKAIEKVTRVAALHQKGDWVDDCYILMAKSQYLKQDYEGAEETLQFFEEQFNPANPNGKNFKKRKPTAKERKAEAEELKKERAKENKERKKQQEKEREERKEAAEKAREEKAEAAKQAKEERAKALEQARKDKELKAEEAKKAREVAAAQLKKDKEAREAEAKREREAQEAERKKAEKEAEALDKKQETTNESRRDAAKRRLEERQKQIEEARAKNLARREEAKKKTNTDVAAKTEEEKEPQAGDKKVDEVVVDEKIQPKKEESTISNSSKQNEETINKKSDVVKVEKKKEEKKQEPIVEEKKETKEDIAKAEDKKKKNKKKEEDKTKYNEGLLWLARTYIKRENYSSADFILKDLEEKENLPKEVRLLVPVAFAEMYIKEKNYEEAIAYLDEAIKIANKKNNKARYAYVAGQLMERNKNFGKAATYYTTSSKNAKDFKLKFMSTLASAKMQAASGGKSPAEVVASISKFLKESKYDDLQDQIYYSMGEIIIESDKSKAKEYFANSSAVNINNKSLKGEACYKMAELELSDKEYASAKAYYDTTLMNISTFDDRYFYVKNMTSNLGPIAENIIKVARVDSLLGLAKLSQSDQKKWAKEQLKKGGNTDAAVTASQAASATKKSNLIIPKAAAITNSNFFAYNTNTRELGKSTFKILWGERKNEDNWRRSVKSYQSNNDVADDSKEKENDDNIEKDDDEQIKAMMANIPTSSTQQDLLNNEKKNALYALGKDFREKLQEYKLSIDALEKYFMLTSSVDADKLPEAMFIAYLDYMDLGNMALANEMKKKMSQEFPNDKYTKLANDPSYLASLNADANNLDRYYEQTLDHFNKSDYATVIERVQKAMETFGRENNMIPKFYLLNAMSLGATQGKEMYIKTLNELINRYPKTDEETKAKEILRFLNGDGTAFKEVDIKEAEEIFTKDENTRHYLVVVIMSFKADDLEKAKISISDYNKQYHRSENLQSGESALSQEEQTQIILIRSFENMDKARSYYDGAMRSRQEFVNNVGFEAFPISQANYRKLMAAKTHSSYRAYFEKNYLNK